MRRADPVAAGVGWRRRSTRISRWSGRFSKACALCSLIPPPSSIN